LLACGDDATFAPPVLSDVAVTTMEDTPVQVVVPITASNPSVVALTITTPPMHGKLSGTGPTWTYTPDANYMGADKAVIRGEDSHGSATANVVIAITPVDDAPVAKPDSFATGFNAPLTVPQSVLLANDTDVDTATLSVTAVAAVATGHGTPAISGTNVVFTPDAGFAGTASFTYTVSDGSLTAVGTVTVTVGTDQAPVAVDDAVTTSEGTTAVIDDATLLANDTDPDGETLAISAVANAAHGTVSHTGTQVTFVPEPGYNGPAGFDYTVTDGMLTDTGSVIVTVTSVNDAPVIITSPGAVNYTENAAAVAIDDAVSVTDADSTTLAGATVQITIGCTADDVLALATPPAGITAAYTADGCALALTGTATVASYQAALRGVSYANVSDTPATAPRTVRFTVNDGEAANNTASATRDLVVTAVNDAPVAVDDTASTEENVTAEIPDSALLANDTDAERDFLVVSAVGNAVHGTVSHSGAIVRFVPEPGYNGPAGFDYTVSDGAATDIGSVVVTVTSVNDAPVVVTSDGAVAYLENALPVAIDAAVSVTDIDSPTLAGATVQITTGCTAADVLALATPPAGITAAYTAASCTLALTGAASITDYQTALRTVSYANVSDAPSTAPRTLQITVDDGELLNHTGSATRELVVTAVDDAPVAVADSAIVDEDSTANPIAVLGNDTDVDGGPISISAITQPINGRVAITGGGTGVTYTPAANFCNSLFGTPDTFTYTLSPGGSKATVSVVVACDDDPPIAVADSATVAEGSTANPINVLGNDNDADGGPRMVAAVTQPAHGTVAIGPGSASVLYTPAAGYCNEAPNAPRDTFTYTLNPGTSSATVSVKVTCACGLNKPTDFVVGSN
jgi:hypothetical protein